MGCSTGDVLLTGPLHGKVLVSECAWALLGAEDVAKSAGSSGGLRLGPRVLISLEKAFDSREIWATVLSRDFLSTQNIPNEDS